MSDSVVLGILVLISLVIYYIVDSSKDEYDRCFDDMEDDGVAVFGLCDGKEGLDMCKSCRYRSEDQQETKYRY